MKIFVSNLSFNVQDQDLKDLFAPYGEVISAIIINDKITRKSRGFGFVEMGDEAASVKAIAALNDTILDGRNIKVTEARPKGEGPSRGNGGSGNRKSRW